MTSTTTGRGPWKMAYFEILLALTQVTGCCMVLLAGYFFNTADTIGWVSNPGSPAFHGLFMIIGLVFFQGEALLSYRLYRYNEKFISKFIHVVFHMLAMSFFATAFANIIMQKNVWGKHHFYSIHSWIGVVVMTVYTIQFGLGVINFVFPCVPDSFRRAFMPLHRIIGAITFGGSIAQVIIGAIQYVGSIGDGSSCYESLSCPHKLDLIFNFFIASLILYGITVYCVILPPAWKRQKTPDEMK